MVYQSRKILESKELRLIQKHSNYNSKRQQLMTMAIGLSLLVTHMVRCPNSSNLPLKCFPSLNKNCLTLKEMKENRYILISKQYWITIILLWKWPRLNNNTLISKQVILKCKINCQPRPEVKWFKGDQDITKDPRVKVYTNPDGQDCLTINSASRSMAGDYECRATNEMGTASSKCTVKVNSKLIFNKLYWEKLDDLLFRAIEYYVSIVRYHAN